MRKKRSNERRLERMTLEKLKAKYKDIVDNRLEQVFGNLVDSSTLAF